MVTEAIHFFTRAHAFGNAIRMCKVSDFIFQFSFYFTFYFLPGQRIGGANVQFGVDGR